MQRSLVFSLLVILLILNSCDQPDPNKQIDDGSVKENFYTSQEMGWTMEIPEGWKVMAKDKLEEMNQKGLDAMEDVAGEFDPDGLKHLISFQKNKANFFLSTSEKFSSESEGDWEENNKAMYRIIYETYKNRGLNVDTSSHQATIDGLTFKVLKIIIYSPSGDKILMNQESYGRLIHDSNFAATLNYNNEEDKKAMMKVWTNSKFSKRE